MNSLPGFNVLLMGTTGTGKTTSLKTLAADPNLEVFAIFTEPRFDILGSEILNKIHWRYIPPAANSWSALMDTAKKVNTLSNDNLQKMTSIAGGEYTQFIDVLTLCNDFVDQNGKSFGDVASWGTDRVLWIDGLTGISKMARKLRVGGKPIMSQPDWGVCMVMVQELVDTLVNGTFCHFVLVTHIEREMDELTGSSRAMVSTLGRKLAPMIPPNFGDVVMAKKDGSEFTWSTTESGVDLKNAFLKLHNKLPPSFQPLLTQWKAQGGVFGTQPPANWQQFLGKEKE